jgi:uncharacterized protein (TIRG00374 family)
VNPKLVKALQFVFFLLVGLVLLFFAFRGIDMNELIVQITQADYRWAALSVLFAVLALVFRTLRWQLLIEPLNEYPKRINIFHAINVGYLANFVFPRIGEITRCGILNRTDRISVTRLFGTVIVERAFDMLMCALMLILILLMRFDVVGSFIMDNIVQPAVKRLPGTARIEWIIAVFVLLILAFYVFYKVFKTQLSKIGALRKIRDLMRGVVKGIMSAYRIRNFTWFMILNFLIFGMYFMQTWVMFFALESTSSLGIGDAMFILVLSALAIILPVQGGIGAYHWIVSMGLTIFGLTREEGMVYATITHSVTSLALITLGAVSLTFVFAGSRKMKNEK